MITLANNTVPAAAHATVRVAVKGIGFHGTGKSWTGTSGVSGSAIGVHGVIKVGPASAEMPRKVLACSPEQDIPRCRRGSEYRHRCSRHQQGVDRNRRDQ
jgi:hypothetical protein